MNNLLKIMLGAAVAASCLALVEALLKAEVTKHVQLELMIQRALINNAPFFKRIAIAWRVVRGKL